MVKLKQPPAEVKISSVKTESVAAVLNAAGILEPALSYAFNVNLCALWC